MDKTAQTHDLRYGLANVDADVRTADNRTVTSRTTARLQKLDSNFNINQAMLIKTKILLKDRLGSSK